MDRPLFVSEFEDMGLSISDDMIDECVIACHSNKISASDFVGSWIAFCASRQIDANNLNQDNFSTLVKSIKTERDEYKIEDKLLVENKQDLNESISHQYISSPTSLKSTNRINDINIQVENDISVSDIIDGDDLKEENTSSTSGDIVCSFGLENIDKNNFSSDVETISLFKQELWNNFIFGHVNYQKFDNHVQELVNSIIKNNNLKTVKSLSELYFSNDNVEITVFGNLKVIKKELYLSSSNGYIKLDLSEAIKPIQALFINQIIVVTGTNPDTKLFKVRKLYTDASLSLPKELPTFSQGNINLMVAAGPFFSESSPHGKSLKSLIQKTIDLEAKLLMLFGPIFEADFGIQLNKTSSENIQECYDNILEAILNPLFSNPRTQNTKLVVFSSWKDINNFAIYPTPPNTESKLPKLYPNNIFMVSDPCVFSANGIIIAGNTSDTLMDLHTSAIYKSQEEMFGKLSRQIIWQRSLHPSFTSSPTVPVDQLLWLNHCTLQENTPHIILTSSQLRTFIRVVEGSMVINVGQLVKHNSQKQAVSGTYGKIQIASSKNNCWSPQTHISAEVIHI